MRPGSPSRAPRRCNRTPSARPRRRATCHSLQGAGLNDVEKGSGCRGSAARDSATKKLSTGPAGIPPSGLSKSLKVFWRKDLGDWESEPGADFSWIFFHRGKPDSDFQSYSVSKIELFWVSVLTFFFSPFGVLKTGHFLRSPRGS